MTLSVSLEFAATNCVTCGVRYCIDTEYQQRRSADHREFYCPNGHATYYTGGDRRTSFSEASPLKEARTQRDRLKTRLSATQSELDALGSRFARVVGERNALRISAPLAADHKQCVDTQRRLEDEADHLGAEWGAAQEEVAKLAGELDIAKANVAYLTGAKAEAAERLAEAVKAGDAAQAELEALRAERDALREKANRAGPGDEWVRKADLQKVIRERDRFAEELGGAVRLRDEMRRDCDAAVKDRDNALLRAAQWEYSAELHLERIAKLKKQKNVPDAPVDSVPEPDLPSGPAGYPMLAMCTCAHSQRRHENNQDMCGATDCACTGFVRT